VKDVVQFLLSSMKHISVNALSYNVCTGRSTSLFQLAKTIMDISGNTVNISYKSSRSGDIQMSVGDPSSSHINLNVQGDVHLVNGLQKLIGYENLLSVKINALNKHRPVTLTLHSEAV
jgi:UDP-glucose 4-epimerase